nr:hypothetical protein GCM10020185_02960 [Pseudomonas brassicacearum subsp. brassicacearum]
MDEINRMFAEDKPALARYNLKDCELVTRIFAKTELLKFLLERASVTGLPADRSGGSVAAFTHLYMPLMHRQGFVAPNLGQRPPEASPGGFVMDSQPGLYESVLVLDYKSLYPSIIRTFLIDPVGLIEGLRHPDDQESVPGFRGARFSRTRHCLPAIVARISEGRETAKREHNAPLSQALKNHHERLLWRARFQWLPFLRHTPGLVHHPARSRDHAAHPPVDRSPGACGDLWRYRFHVRLASSCPWPGGSGQDRSRVGGPRQPMVA